MTAFLKHVFKVLMREGMSTAFRIAYPAFHRLPVYASNSGVMCINLWPLLAGTPPFDKVGLRPRGQSDSGAYVRRGVMNRQ